MPMSRVILLCGTAVALAAPFQPVSGQEAVPAPTTQQAAPAEPTTDEELLAEDQEAIVVRGERQRGAVIGDIPPENQLDARDIRATGATSIDELLEALAPQIGSARGREAGGRPVLLLNGRRISGFRELRDIPPEAIERMDILPEEVALKYGYRADQRVVNIVLRQRFRSTVARADGQAATDGGHGAGLADVTRLMINRGGRTTFNLHAEANSALDENERDIVRPEIAPGENDPRPFRSLIGSRRQVRGSGTINRTILGDVSATFNSEVEHSDGRSGLGLDGIEPLLRDTESNAARLGFALNGDKGRWRWSATGNGEWQRSVTDTERDGGVTDRAESTRKSAGLDGTASGPLFKLPAGDASATVKLGGDTLGLDAERCRAGIISSSDLGRTRGNAAVNLDLPILKNGPVGRFSANANAEVEQYSDFGTLTTVGAGLNWSPVERLNLIGSWTREEGAPSVNQLGDPLFETPDTPVFDFTQSETVSATVITGGNPDLDADRRSVLKLGANWKPFDKTDLRLRADYVRSRIDRPISSFPGPSAALEAAFPERFVRDPGGNLVSVDLRPVNFDESRRETIRWGFDFSKPLKSARPSQSQIEQLRQQFRRRAGDLPAGSAPPPPPSGEPPPEAVIMREGPPGGGPGAGGRGGGGGFRGSGMFGGGPNRGRLQFSLTHTLTLVDEATIRPDVPKIDYLHGDALNALGGRSRHQVEARAGWSNNGLGARLSGNWRSGTRVEGGENGDLRFSPLGTVDLRLFANLGERFELVSKHPWLIGSSVRLEVDNLFDAKPRVRDALGDVPLSHQADLLDPLGRTVTISFRKLFLPQRFRARSRGPTTAQ